MKISTLIFACLFAVAGFGQQLEFTTEAVADGQASGKLAYEFTVTNISTTTASFYWAMDRSSDVPRDWLFTICDANVCYPEGVEAAPCDGENILAAGQSVTYYKVGLDPKDVAGRHDVSFKILDDCVSASPNTIGEITITFNAAGGSSVEDLETENILLYPNPALDRFQINKDENVSSLAIFNIVGKNIRNVPHTPGQSHDVSDFENGFYLVRILDANQNTLKVIRLTKE